jgi:hypothetical protein
LFTIPSWALSGCPLVSSENAYASTGGQIADDGVRPDMLATTKDFSGLPAKAVIQKTAVGVHLTS